MPSILLTGDCAPLMPGMALHAPDLHIEQRPDGLPVRAALRPGPLCVTLTDSGGEIAAPTKAAFFRGLSLLCQHCTRGRTARRRRRRLRRWASCWTARATPCPPPAPCAPSCAA